jgi:hypothetical protein
MADQIPTTPPSPHRYTVIAGNAARCTAVAGPAIRITPTPIRRAQDEEP